MTAIAMALVEAASVVPADAYVVANTCSIKSLLKPRRRSVRYGAKVKCGNSHFPFAFTTGLFTIAALERDSEPLVAAGPSAFISNGRLDPKWRGATHLGELFRNWVEVNLTLTSFTGQKVYWINFPYQISPRYWITCKGGEVPVAPVATTTCHVIHSRHAFLGASISAEEAAWHEVARAGVEGDNTCTARCCGMAEEATVIGLDPTASAEACDVAGQDACAAQGKTLHHVRWNGHPQQWHPCTKECCAKCENRDAYHQVTQPDDDWVFENCTDYATQWCDVGDRGGLEDAAWTPLKGDGTDQCVNPQCLTSESIVNTLVASGGSPQGLDVASNGDVYFAHGTWWLDKLKTDGTIESLFSFAGYYDSAFRPRVMEDGSIYYLRNSRDCCGGRGLTQVVRFDPTTHSGTVVAGYYQLDCAGGFAGDGGPAVDASICPTDFVVDGSGVVYIAGQNRIRRVGLDGIITTIAGTGDPSGPLGDGGPATLASIGPGKLDMGADGSLYLDSGDRIRRIDPNGIITTIAGPGTGASDPCADSVSALDASWGVFGPGDLRVGADDNVYVGSRIYNGGACVRRISPDGLIERVAGRGTGGVGGESVPALDAALDVGYFTLGPDGSLYTMGSEIRKVSCGTP